MADHGDTATEPPQCPCGGDHNLALTAEQARAAARVLFTVRQRIERKDAERAATTAG
jgi:hypothetical protein